MPFGTIYASVKSLQGNFVQVFKKDESLFDIGVKLATMISICFAVWAYFHTVHPRFEKENELSALKAELDVYTSEKEKILANIDSIKIEAASAKKQVDSLKFEKEKLQIEIQRNEKLLAEHKASVEEKDRHINSLLAEKKDAGHIAIYTKLEKIATQINSKYLSSIPYDSNKFDLLSICNEIYENEAGDIDNVFEEKALSFFRAYIDSKASEAKTGDDIIHFAVYLPFEYKLEAWYGFNKRVN